MNNMQSIYILAKDTETTMSMLTEVFSDISQDIKTTHLMRVTMGKLTIATSACLITFVDMSKNPMSNIRGVRCNVLVVDNNLRFDRDWFHDVLEPMLSASYIRQGSETMWNGLLIGWYQFMSTKGLLKYVNGDRWDVMNDYENTVERIFREDYFRDDVVRFGHWKEKEREDEGNMEED